MHAAPVFITRQVMLPPALSRQLDLAAKELHKTVAELLAIAAAEWVVRRVAGLVAAVGGQAVR